MGQEQVGPTGRVLSVDVDTRFQEPSGGLVEVRTLDITSEPLGTSSIPITYYPVTGPYSGTLTTEGAVTAFNVGLTTIQATHNTTRDDAMWISLFALACAAAVCLSVAAVLMQQTQSPRLSG